MRIITGALAFLASSTGIISEIAPVILLPNPPPVYSLTTTTFSGGTLTQRDTPTTVCAVLCVPVYTWTLPFCQYAITERVSSVWWLVSGVTKVSSRTSAASLKPTSRSPYCQASGAPCIIGRRPASASASSAGVHFISLISGRGGLCGGGAPGAGGGGMNQ